MWGNYLSAFLTDAEFGENFLYYWQNQIYGGEEDWFNPGFLKHVNDIQDMHSRYLFLPNP